MPGLGFVITCSARRSRTACSAVPRAESSRFERHLSANSDGSPVPLVPLGVPPVPPVPLGVAALGVPPLGVPAVMLAALLCRTSSTLVRVRLGVRVRVRVGVRARAS